MAVPNLWRTKEQRYRLQGNVCPACSNAIFPPKRVCPHCHYGAAATAKADEHQAYSFIMVFEVPQVTELNATGDD